MTGLAVAVIAGVVLLSGGVEASAWKDRKTELDTYTVWHLKSSSRQKTAGVTYKVVGIFQREKQFIGGSAVADVTEQVEFEFTWPLVEGTQPKVLPNNPTKVDNLRDGSAECPAPVLKGTYEHFDLKSMSVIGTMFGLVGERRTPDMEEYVGGGGCKGTHPVQGQVREEQLLVTVPLELLAGPVPKGQVMKQQDQGWTWTFTPLP
ncbi:MAG: hypothetical protein ABS70_02980 [Nitrospira sp. SCN 59-13]|nr:MAG: hypothetical protein ABS70_02980 [Nitrospira sp. SCN 59-13]